MNNFAGHCEHGNFTSKNKDLERKIFLSVGCDGRYRALVLQRKKQIKIERAKNIKVMRSIGINKTLARKIVFRLEQSGLSLSKQRAILKQIRRLLLDFKRDLFTLLNIDRSVFRSLPLWLKRKIIALLVLKAEIAHLFRLMLKRQREICRKNNLSRISIDDYALMHEHGDLEYHKLYRMGVSLSKGNYEGLRGDKNNDYSSDKKQMRFNFDTTKKTRNETDKRRQNGKNYCGQQKYIGGESSLNSDDFYRWTASSAKGKDDSGGC